MSWCRWSSLNFTCDLYVYESEAGVELHVAAKHPDIDLDGVPAPVSIVDDMDAWRLRHEEVQRRLDAATHDAITLPHAGESHTFDTLHEAADFIDTLDRLGYVIPPKMTEQMREVPE